MSGSVAEALLASGSKKLPLLPPPPKIKKDPKTFAFDLELAESNEQTYPEFSWMELVRNAKQKELTKKVETGAPTLNPYASDDEEDLKAMAAKFEAKYNNNTVATTKKKKRRVEDYIDRGAGYDESDPFIDNSDVYDEVVPEDLQTKHGGFYINSGSLDFKEVELSEDDDDSLSQSPVKAPKIKKAKTKITPCAADGVLKQKNPVGRPPGVGNKRPITPADKNEVLKKRKIITIPVEPGGKLFSKPKKINNSLVKPVEETTPIHRLENPKPKVATTASSSSASSSSSSSEESSSSSDSESSSSEETEEKNKEAPPKLKYPAPIKVKTAAAAVTPSVISKPIPNNVVRKPGSLLSSSVVPAPNQIKRQKTKHVPLNPKLHPHLPVSTSTTVAPVVVSSNLSQQNITPPQQQIQSRVLNNNKDLIKTNNSGGNSINISPRNLSPSSSSGIMSIPTSSPSMKLPPPPKPVSTPMLSPGITISAATSQTPKSSNSITTTKPKMKTNNKPGVNSINLSSPSPLDIFNSIATGGYPSLSPNLNNFASSLNPHSTGLKSGMGMVGTPKAMPNLKKMAQASSTEKLVQKQPKAAVPKPVKSNKPKQTNSNNLAVTPPSHTSAFNSSGGSSSNAYLSTLSSYKTPPPPLAGPGVEISKVRTSSVINSGVVNSIPKSVSNTTQFSPGSLGLATVSLAHSTSNNTNALIASSSFLNAGINTILNSSPSSLVGNMPSSLTVQRLPQSITITPTSQQSVYPIGAIQTSSNKSHNLIDTTKVGKHISNFDVSSILQSSVGSYTNNPLLGFGNSKSGAGKSTNNITNNRDLQRK